MNMRTNPTAEHPHFVHIPDPAQTEGVRAYAEPDEPHALQLSFLKPEGERAWVESVAQLLASGRADEADALIAQELAGLHGRLARLCKAAPADAVSVEGWDDLLPILADWEGPPITAITIGMTNPSDLVFDPTAAPEPELLLGLYSDEAFPFADSTNAELIAECERELPAWVGGEEDVEFYCTMSGLSELNGALINWKHRHFLRDGRDGVEGRAPGGYVEFVVANWFVATRFLQAVQRAIADFGVPDGCRVIAGSVDMNADFITILGKERKRPADAGQSAEPVFATLTVKPWTPRDEPPPIVPEAPATLRQRILTPEPEPEPKPSFVRRLFARIGRR